MLHNVYWFYQMKLPYSVNTTTLWIQCIRQHKCFKKEHNIPPRLAGDTLLNVNASACEQLVWPRFRQPIAEFKKSTGLTKRSDFRQRKFHFALQVILSTRRQTFPKKFQHSHCSSARRLCRTILTGIITSARAIYLAQGAWASEEFFPGGE